MHHIQLTICFLLPLLTYLSIGQINGQESTIKFTYEENEKHRCLMSNRGRQRAISKCFTYYTTRNCSLLSRHMQCYIKEKKRICEVESDHLLNEAFRQKLRRKFIRNLTANCGPYFETDLRIYACRDCTLTRPALELVGDPDQITTSQVERDNSCLQMILQCHPDSKFWKSKIKMDSVQHPFFSSDFGKPAVASIFCQLRPKAWTHGNHTVKQIICDSKAIARKHLDHGCGLCRLENVPVRRTGDIMFEPLGKTDKGCANLTFACGTSSRDYLSQLTINNKEKMNSTSAGSLATLVVTCTDDHDRWIRIGANAPKEPITDLHCDNKAFATKILGIPCGTCTQQKPKIEIIGAITESPTKEGCKIITVKCTPRNTDWISQMEIKAQINGQSARTIINSTALGEPIEFQVFCPSNKTAWRDDEGKKITSVKCTDNAFAGNVLRDGCGTCRRDSLKFARDRDATFSISEDFTPTGGCRRLKLQCTPMNELDATLTANGDPSTSVKAATDLPAFQTLVCQNTSKGPLWKIDNSSNYTAGISKISCTTRFTRSGSLSYGCGVCKKGNKESWHEIDSASDRAPTSKGCKVVEIQCKKYPTAQSASIVFNQKHTIPSQGDYAIATITCTSSSPDGISGRSDWTYKDRHKKPIVIHTLQCKGSEYSIDSDCQSCPMKPPTLNLTGIEYYGRYTGISNCLRLTLYCYCDYPAYRSRLSFPKIDSFLSDVGYESVWKELLCEKNAWIYESSPNWRPKITAAVCEPRAERNLIATKPP